MATLLILSISYSLSRIFKDKQSKGKSNFKDKSKDKKEKV